MNAQQAEYERLTALDAKQAAAAEAAKQAAATNLALGEREQAYLRALDQKDRDQREAFARLQREVNLCQVFDYEWAAQRARVANPKKPIFPLAGEFQGKPYHASREEAAELYNKTYIALCSYAGYQNTPHFSTLRRPTPKEAKRILDAWATEGDHGRAKRRLAVKAAELRRYIERLDAGDEPAERELYE